VRLALRIAVVLAAALVWVAISTTALFLAGVGKASFNTETTFGNALGDAQTDALRDDPTSSLRAVCGFPALEHGSSVELSHADVAAVAQCLRRTGYLDDEELRSIETSAFGMFVECSPATTPGDAGRGSEQTACVYSYTNADGGGRGWLPTAISLAGLPIVVWLVGFRLPWWRRDTGASSGAAS